MFRLAGVLGFCFGLMAQSTQQLESGAQGLQQAIKLGNAEQVKRLISAGVDVNAPFRSTGSIPLQFAILGNRGDPAITPLDEAILYGHADIAAFLIAHGADARLVPASDARGPLHEACVKGLFSLVQPLVDAGADPGQPDRFGETPVDLALAFKNAKVVFALLHLRHGAQQADVAAERAMEMAVTRSRTETARILVENGFNINKPTLAGSTYLHDAALAGAPKILDLFLDHGAEIDARDPETGATPLIFAAAMARFSAVALLLRRGADPALRDRAGHTALDRARETDDDQTIKLLETALAGSGDRRKPV